MRKNGARPAAFAREAPGRSPRRDARFNLAASPSWQRLFESKTRPRRPNLRQIIRAGAACAPCRCRKSDRRPGNIVRSPSTLVPDGPGGSDCESCRTSLQAECRAPSVETRGNLKSPNRKGSTRFGDVNVAGDFSQSRTTLRRSLSSRHAASHRAEPHP